MKKCWCQQIIEGYVWQILGRVCPSVGRPFLNRVKVVILRKWKSYVKDVFRTLYNLIEQDRYNFVQLLNNLFEGWK